MFDSNAFTIRPPTPARSLALRPGERGVFAGQTGSGKTTAILRMLTAYYGKRQIIIADTKNDPTIETLYGPVATRLRDLPRIAQWPKNPLLIYRPNGNELADLTILDAFCDWVYRRGRTVLVIDELGQFAAGAHAGPGLTSIFARGRTAEVTTLAGTQRPVSVPIIAFTESQKFFIFRLIFKNDRERLARYAHPALIEPPSSPYGVKVYRTGDQDPIEYTSLTQEHTLETPTPGRIVLVNGETAIVTGVHGDQVIHATVFPVGAAPVPVQYIPSEDIADENAPRSYRWPTVPAPAPVVTPVAEPVAQPEATV